METVSFPKGSCLSILPHSLILPKLPARQLKPQGSRKGKHHAGGVLPGRRIRSAGKAPAGPEGQSSTGRPSKAVPLFFQKRPKGSKCRPPGNVDIPLPHDVPLPRQCTGGRPGRRPLRLKNRAALSQKDPPATGLRISQPPGHKIPQARGNHPIPDISVRVIFPQIIRQIVGHLRPAEWTEGHRRSPTQPPLPHKKRQNQAAFAPGKTQNRPERPESQKAKTAPLRAERRTNGLPDLLLHPPKQDPPIEPDPKGQAAGHSAEDREKG